MFRRSLTSLTIALAVLTATAAQAAEPLPVVATFSILGDMVQQVGGDNVKVTTLVAPGGDAHVYQPTPTDAQTLAGAKLIVVNGLGMEGWIDRLIAASGSKAVIAPASTGVAAQIMEEEEGGSTKRVTDPHAWQNLKNGGLYIRNIAEALAKADPANAVAYRQRADSYGREIADLDVWVRQQIEQVPPTKRKIITSHDAFGYFAKAYGVEFLAPVGLNTDSEPTAAGLAKLTKQIRQEGIKALFIENMTDPRLIKTLAKETGAVVGGALYSDSLSPAGGPADTYLKMFRHNIPAIVEAMGKN